METLIFNKKKALTCGVLCFALLLIGGALWLGFSSGMKSDQKEAAGQKALLAHDQALLSHQQEYESEWKAKEIFFSKSERPEESLNLWVKSILDYAQGQKIVFEKIEPGGIQEKDGRKTMRLVLQFQGDIGKLIKILHHFYEADPLTQIRSLSLKAEEGSKAMEYEIGLGKVLS